MYNVLVTNDDGIDAAGIRQLIFTLSLTTQVYVFAPKEQQSAKSQAMSAQGQLSVESRSIRGAEEAYAVGGTPVDCVKFGLQTMAEKGVSIDYVISGINMGLNLGADIHYSGTVGAAMEGAISGVRGIALSVEHYQPDYY